MLAKERVGTSGSQRDVVYLSWPIAPSYLNPNAGGGGLRGLSKWVQLCTWSPMGDLAPYLTYCLNYKDMSIEKIIYRVRWICPFCDQAMVGKVEGCTGFLIDGFPLDLEEAEKFEKQIVPVTRQAPQDHHTYHAFFLSLDLATPHPPPPHLSVS